ncbi:hypothetical protein SAMN03159338_1484 [Sphingomonas sp. NFR04]|uniref:hypothetical protein n=1 Tax=Sphingomonas sp. NFR04 TaxID=1566283 RepID=UPI0008F12B89|nr:hypothetical protein [Sphingomonas sp. NFR04]SFJ47208.1 hypothetical protein SAMN03159338_1484 [Sphingomonas sp. NFR04]
MNVTLATYGMPILPEVDHTEIVKIDHAVASMVRARMGEPWRIEAGASRFSGIMVLHPTMRGAPIVPMPFEMVVCPRGASIRCHWSDMGALMEIIQQLAPAIEIIAIAA